MLVFSRQEGQAIVVGDDVRIQIVSARSGRARIGITAPGGVSVHRLEIYDRIHRQRASRSGEGDSTQGKPVE